MTRAGRRMGGRTGDHQSFFNISESDLGGGGLLAMAAEAERVAPRDPRRGGSYRLLGVAKSAKALDPFLHHRGCRRPRPSSVPVST